MMMTDPPLSSSHQQQRHDRQRQDDQRRPRPRRPPRRRRHTYYNPIDIANCALDHYYNKLPKHKGKPKLNLEWTVYAAIVATTTTTTTKEGDDDDDDDNSSHHCWVVSCATGTKCTAVTTTSSTSNGNGNDNGSGSKNVGGCIIHDSHAEVLAKRGLMYVLQKEIIQYHYDNDTTTTTMNDAHQKKKKTKNDDDDISRRSISSSRLLLEPINDNDEKDKEEEEKTTTRNILRTKFRLRSNIQLHLYVSDSPCGDSSIYNVNTNCVNNINGEEEEEEEINDQSNEDKKKSNNNNNNNNKNNKNKNKNETLQYTGAKIIVSTKTGVTYNECGGHHQRILLPPNSNNNKKEEMIIMNGGDDHNKKNYESNTTTILETLIQVEDSKTTTTDTPAAAVAAKRTTNDNNHTMESPTSHSSSAPSSSCNVVTDEVMAVVAVAREDIQLLGKLRTKAGRSNIPNHLRSTSMSCSDKIVHWCILGLQGGLLSTYIPYPIVFSSIIVSHDPRSISTSSRNNKRRNDSKSTITNTPATTTSSSSSEDHQNKRRKVTTSEYINAISTPNESKKRNHNNNININRSSNLQSTKVLDCDGIGIGDTEDKSSYEFDSQYLALKRAIPDRVLAVRDYLRSVIGNGDETDHDGNHHEDHEVTTSTPTSMEQQQQTKKKKRQHAVLSDWINDDCSYVPSIFIVPQSFVSGKAESAYNKSLQEQQQQQQGKELAPADSVGAATVPDVETTATTQILDTQNEQKTEEEPPKILRKQDLSRKRKRDSEKAGKKGGCKAISISPCGFSLNWQQDVEGQKSRQDSGNPLSQLMASSSSSRKGGNDAGFDVELIVGARGIVQGKKPKSLDDYKRSASRLSRWKMYQRMIQLLPKGSKGDDGTDNVAPFKTYQQLKRDYCCSKEWKELQELIRHGGPLAGWITSRDQGDFDL